MTQTIASQGDGAWQDYVGGYVDWERQHKTTKGPSAIDRLKSTPAAQSKAGTKAQENAATPLTPAPTTATQALGAKSKQSKLAPWEVKELEHLPADINKLEQEQESLVAQMGDSSLYKDDPNKLTQIQTRLSEIEADMTKRFARWEALEARNN